MKYMKNLVNNAGILAKSSMNVAQSSINALSYANKYLLCQPTFEPFTVDDIEMIVGPTDDNKTDIITIVESCSKSEQLAKHIADKLITYYKKDDPDQQIIWSCDTSRTNYIIRKPIDNNQQVLQWIQDKNGVCLREQVVKPILKNIDEIIIQHIQDTNDKIQSSTKTRSFQVRDTLRLQTRYGIISNDITNGLIENEIIKQMAPPLFLSTKNCISK